MADQQTEKEPQQPVENINVEPQVAKSSLMGKLKVVGIIAGVVLIECIAAYLFIPSAVANTPSSAEAVKAAEAELASHGKEKEEAKEGEGEQVEVDLEEFRVTYYQPASDTTFRISFHLYGIIEAAEEAEKKEFEEILKANKARMREQVNVIVRSAEIPELTDPTLGLIKRRILDKINRILGKPLLKDVIFSDISFVEQ